jgi:hypothetical protein
MDATQIETLERQMVEEHKKDLEALARLKRFLPSNGSTPKPPDERQMRLPVNLEVRVEDDMEDAPVVTLRGKIEQTVNSDPNLKWTTQKVLAHLRQVGFPLNAKKPIYSVGQSLKILADQGRIRLVRKGLGSAPNIYRAKITAQAENTEVPSTTENNNEHTIAG